MTRNNNILLLVLIFGILGPQIKCSEWKGVDTSLRERRIGDMGLGIQYENLVWRFTNNTRQANRGVKEAECIWQAKLKNLGSESLTVAIGFRLFDIEDNMIFEIQYKVQKKVYPDTIAQFLTLNPADSSRTIRSSFWVDMEKALKVTEGDIYIVETLIDTTLTDTMTVSTDTVAVNTDTTL